MIFSILANLKGPKFENIFRDSLCPQMAILCTLMSYSPELLIRRVKNASCVTRNVSSRVSSLFTRPSPVYNGEKISKKVIVIEGDYVRFFQNPGFVNCTFLT